MIRCSECGAPAIGTLWFGKINCFLPVCGPCRTHFRIENKTDFGAEIKEVNHGSDK